MVLLLSHSLSNRVKNGCDVRDSLTGETKFSNWIKISKWSDIANLWVSGYTEIFQVGEICQWSDVGNRDSPQELRF